MMRSLFYDYVRHGAVIAASATTESWFRIEAANYGYGLGALYNYGTGAPPATANQFAPGAIYQRVDASPALYVNTGTLASPTWTTVAASSTTMALTYAATTASSQITATTNGNSASLVMNVLSAVYTQTTTARTSGSANGVLVTITGLAGDGASATFNGINLAAPTTNGGSAVYTGIAFGTGWTYLVDTSACATGTAKWRMKTNVASAYVLQDSAATPVVFMTAITTTATPSLAVTVPLTTTNGITSGTARLVGGIAYNLAAAGSTLTGKVLKLDANTRWVISRNLRKLLKVAEDIDKVRTDLQKDQATFETEMIKLMKIEVEVPLHTVKLADLNLDVNEIGVQALTALDALIEE